MRNNREKCKFAKLPNIIACQKLMIYSIPPIICRHHVINEVKVFTSSSLGPCGVLDRAVGSRYRIKSLGVYSHCWLSGDEYWAKCHFDCLPLLSLVRGHFGLRTMTWTAPHYNLRPFWFRGRFYFNHCSIQAGSNSTCDDHNNHSRPQYVLHTNDVNTLRIC